MIAAATLVSLVVCPAAARAQGAQTIALFETQCSACHTAAAGAGRAPTREALRQRTPESIFAALTTGTMAEQAKGLSDEQKRALAEMLSGRPVGAAASGDASVMPNRCEAAPLGNPLKGPRWNGWGADLANTRFQPASSAGLNADQVPDLTLKWAFGFPGGSSAYGQPTVAAGRVYVGADTGFVYALDATTGCVHWSFRAQAGVRTAISIGALRATTPPRYALYFGDVKANVYAIDADTGREIWTKRADTHQLARITGAPALAAGRLYVPVASMEELAGGNPVYECCTFRGSVVAYDATSGRQIWKRYTIAQPPAPTKKTSRGTQLWAPAGAAVWSAPTIDAKRGRLYIATGDAYTAPAATTSDAVMALNLADGRVVWSKQLTANDAFVWPCESANFSETCPPQPGPDFDFGNSPILRARPAGAGDLLVIGQKSGAAWGLDPEKQGAIVWQHKVGKGSWDGGLVWGAAADTRHAYFANVDAYFGAAEAGGLAALKLENGERVWFTRPPAMTCGEGAGAKPCVQGQSAAITAIPGVVFSGTTTGVMRAYRTADGSIIWEYATARPFATVNGVTAKGGAIDGPGPTVAGGMVFFNSGYSTLGTREPGNVLLAFGVEQ
jgi:polyvinyl alcohol dehydrogenase (cytochrome)